METVNQQKEIAPTQFSIHIPASNNEAEMKAKAAKISAILGEEFEIWEEISCPECQDTYLPDDFAMHMDREHDIEIDYCPQCKKPEPDEDKLLYTQGICDDCFKKNHEEYEKNLENQNKPKPTIHTFFINEDAQGHMISMSGDIPRIQRFQDRVLIYDSKERVQA